MVSTSRKKVLNKQEYVFFWTEKCVSINRDEGFLEKYLRQGQKWFPLAIKSVSTQKNNSLIAGIENSLKKTFPLNEKQAFTRRSLEEICINGLYQPENPFALPEMKYSLKIRFHHSEKLYFFWQENRRKRFPLTGNVFLLNWFLLISIMISNSREKAPN